MLVQAILLLLIFWSGRRGGRTSIAARATGSALMLGGISLGLLSGRRLGRNLTPLPAPIEGGTLVTSGAYAYVRHPIYSALLLLCTGFGIWRGSGPALGYTAILALLFDRKTAFRGAATRR